MKFWDDIVQAALIGTAKQGLRAEHFPAPVAEKLQAAAGDDAESLFLKGLVLSAQFRRSGALPVDGSVAERWECPAETQAPCSERAAIILESLLDEGEPMLVHFWLDQCRARKLRVPAHLVAPLLQFVSSREELQDAAAACCGFTGNWLATFNSDWDFAAGVGGEERWRTGKAQERLAFLTKLRKQDPARARTLLMETWEEENAHQKAAFLEVLSIHLSNADLPWLEQLQGEKSEKVRAVRCELLKRLPDSKLVRAFADALQASISITRSKVVLGLIEQLNISITNPVSLSDEVQEAGIKLVQSDIYSAHPTLAALFRSTPPGMWANRFNERPEAIVSLFRNHVYYKNYLPEITKAVLHFQELAWIDVLGLRNEAPFDALIASALPAPLGLEYAWKRFAKAPREVVLFLRDAKYPWTIEQARTVLRFTTAEPYGYNKNFYLGIVWQLPEEIRFELGAFGPENVNHYWDTIKAEIEKILSLKAQILQSF